jgi:hypothetical protein
MLLRFTLIYGVISFLLAPLLGESLTRLYGYSWPLFLVALPLLLGVSRANFSSAWAAVAFVALHVVLSWSTAFLYPLRLLIAGMAAWICGWFLLRAAWVAQGGADTENASPIDPAEVL